MEHRPSHQPHYSINVPSLRDLSSAEFAGGVSAGRGGFSFLGGRRSLTGWMYPKPRPAFLPSPSGNWDGANRSAVIDPYNDN
ncbi:MAG: hypothetical protein J0M05_00585 [Candidatus Kapabacteria bacterium]|nr:hypothetical protein [Candidatus Kapabacteria bacterium]